MTATVSVSELQRAWAAVAEGEFRLDRTTRRLAGSPSMRWKPEEDVVVVAGAAGRVGATTTALAIATACRQESRVIECAPMHASGLANATSAELGVTTSGWRRGSRDHVLIERVTATLAGPSEVPLPTVTDRTVTVLDVGWDLTTALADDSWLASTVFSAPLVLVTTATVPGLRALDHALHLAAGSGTVWCVITGLNPKRWPKPVQVSITPAIDAVIDEGRLITTPHSEGISVTGLTPDPLPPELMAACQPILEQMREATKGKGSS